MNESRTARASMAANLSSMREVLAYAFGLDNERVTSRWWMERTASNTAEDA